MAAPPVLWCKLGQDASKPVPINPDGHVTFKWTKLDPGSLRLGGIPSLVDDGSRTTYPAAAVQALLKQQGCHGTGESPDKPLEVTGDAIPGFSASAGGSWLEEVKTSLMEVLVKATASVGEQVERHMARALALHELAKQDTLSITASKASSKRVAEAAKRMHKHILPGPPFAHQAGVPCLPPHEWPLHSTRQTQDEELGYPTAIAFVQLHLCPGGATALLRQEDSFCIGTTRV